MFFQNILQPCLTSLRHLLFPVLFPPALHPTSSPDTDTCFSLSILTPWVPISHHNHPHHISQHSFAVPHPELALVLSASHLGQLEDIKQMITNSTELAAHRISICMDNPASLTSYEWLTVGLASEILARALANLYWAFINNLSFKTSGKESNLGWQEIPPQCNCHSSDHVFGLCSVEQGVPRNLRGGNEKFLEPHFSSQHLC